MVQARPKIQYLFKYKFKCINMVQKYDTYRALTLKAFPITYFFASFCTFIQTNLTRYLLIPYHYHICCSYLPKYGEFGDFCRLVWTLKHDHFLLFVVLMYRIPNKNKPLKPPTPQTSRHIIYCTSCKNSQYCKN